MHHAFLYLSPSYSLQSLPSALQKPATDVVHITVASFSISDARALQHAAHQRPLQADTRSFVIVATTVTPEAQNALLKLLEEPPHSAQFYIVVAHENILLPTLRSRLHKVDSSEEAVDSKAWRDFMAGTYQERLDSIALAAKKKDTLWLSAQLSSATADNTLPKQTALLLDMYGRQSGASKKMLLELAAIMLP